MPVSTQSSAIWADKNDHNIVFELKRQSTIRNWLIFAKK
jgi:hypothetical protein